MNAIACDVIKDLLPLYVDDVCSEKTKDLIEEHLAECEECQKYYDALQENLPEIKVSSSTYDSWSNFNQEKEFIQKVSKKIQKKVTFNGLVAGFLCFLLGMFLISSYSSLTTNPLQFIPFFDQRVPVEDISITEIYELENGDIYFTLWSNEGINWSYMTALDYDGNLEENTKYFASAQLTTYTWWDKLVNRIPPLHSVSFIYQTEQINQHTLEDEKLHDISSIYYIGKVDKRLTIWEEGQKLEKAPEEIESKVADGRIYADYDRQGFALYNWDIERSSY